MGIFNKGSVQVEATACAGLGKGGVCAVNLIPHAWTQDHIQIEGDIW